MSGREGVLDEPPLKEKIDEPPIGNEACPQTSPNPDAVVLGGIPLDDETAAPGERAGTGTPSASSTHDPPSLNSDMEGFRNFMTQDRTTDEWAEHRWAVSSPLKKVHDVIFTIADVAVGVRLVYDSDRLFWLYCVAFFTCYALYKRYILPWLERKVVELAIEDWRLSGGDALEVSYEPTSCAVNIFGCSPTWRHWTRMLEHETDPRVIDTITKLRSFDLSAADTGIIVLLLSLYAMMCVALYYVISGRGRVWGILYFVYGFVFEFFSSVALILWARVRIWRNRGRYSQASLDPL